MFDHATIKRRRRSGSAGLPIKANDKTYFWDFSTDTRTLNGSDISAVPEMVRGEANYIQATGATQPAAHTDGAVFTVTDNEEMELENPIPLNAATGIYSAFLMKFDASYTGGQFYKVYASDNPAKVGRLALDPLDFGGYNTYTYIDQNDGNSYLSRLRPSVPLSRGSWTLIEHFHDFTAGTVRYWVDGVEDESATLFTAFVSSAYPASDSLGARIGANLLGTVKAHAVYDGIIPDTIRQSISDYLLSIKP